jgi:hypothetical protein
VSATSGAQSTVNAFSTGSVENAVYYPEADMVELGQFNQLERPRSVTPHPQEDQVVVRHL